MGARSGSGVRFGKNASPLQKAAQKAFNAFYSKGVRAYFNGGGNPSENAKAYDRYQKAMSEFKKVWDSRNGKPAFDDYFSAMQSVAYGEIG